MNAETEAIQETIAKLLRKAEGTSNEHEAALFAAKAQELLARHNLDEAKVRARDATASDPITEQNYGRKSVAPWRRQVAQGCAKLYFCRLLCVGSELEFVGKSHNVEVAISMTNWLCSVVVRMAREYDSDRREQEDFKRGAGLRLYGRLMELYRQQNPIQERAKPGGGSGLPALYHNEETEVAEFLEQRYGKLGHKRSRGLQIRGGAGAAGYDRAGEISLNTQVAERRSSRMIGSR